MDEETYKENEEIQNDREDLASNEHMNEEQKEEVPDFIPGNFQQIQKCFELGDEKSLKDALLIGKNYNDTHYIEDSQVFYKYKVPEMMLELLSMKQDSVFSHILLQYIASLLDIQNDKITKSLISFEFFDKYMFYFLNHADLVLYDSMRLLQVCILANKDFGEVFLEKVSISTLKNIYGHAVMYGKYTTLLLLCVLIDQNIELISITELIDFFESLDFNPYLFDSTVKELLIRCIYCFCKKGEENTNIIIQSDKLNSFPFSLLDKNQSITKKTKNLALELISYFYDIDDYSYQFDFDILYSFLSDEDDELFASALSFIRSVTANSNMIQYIVENNLIELLRELWEKSQAKYKEDIIHSICNIVMSTSDDFYPSLTEHSIIEFLIDILANYDETICVRQCLKSLFFILFSAVKQSDEIVDVYQDRLNSANGLEVIEHIEIDKDDKDAQQYHSFIMELLNPEQS